MTNPHYNNSPNTLLKTIDRTADLWREWETVASETELPVIIEKGDKLQLWLSNYDAKQREYEEMVKL